MITAGQERVRLLRDRLERAGLKRAAASLTPDGCRSHGVIVQIVFFGLTCAGLGAFFFLLYELGVAQPEIVTGCFALALAEYLIRARRWFGTGVEAALWIGGLFALINALPSSGSPEKFLVLLAAAALAGFRVRSALFGALAAILLIVYCEEKANLGVIAGIVVAGVAVAALLRTWRRPSTEWLWVLVALVAPIAARAQSDAAWRDVTLLLFIAYGLLTLAIAIRARHHALFLSGGIALAIAATDLARLSAAPAEAHLAIGGALLLAGSWLVSRALRDRTSGLVTTPASLTSVDDTLELLGTANLPQQEFDPARDQGGGSFGGAGATGSY